MHWSGLCNVPVQLHVPELILHHWVALSAQCSALSLRSGISASETPVASFQAFLPVIPDQQIVISAAQSVTFTRSY